MQMAQLALGAPRRPIGSYANLALPHWLLEDLLECMLVLELKSVLPRLPQEEKKGEEPT